VIGSGRVWSCLVVDNCEIPCYTFPQMSRRLQVALALFAIFSITFVLVTPDPTDDVTAVSRPSHFGKALKLAVCVVHRLALPIAIFRLSTPSSSNQPSTTLELVDLLCSYRC
jgi:hypothetical protein